VESVLRGARAGAEGRAAQDDGVVGSGVGSEGSELIVRFLDGVDAALHGEGSAELAALSASFRPSRYARAAPPLEAECAEWAAAFTHLRVRGRALQIARRVVAAGEEEEEEEEELLASDAPPPPPPDADRDAVVEELALRLYGAVAELLAPLASKRLAARQAQAPVATLQPAAAPARRESRPAAAAARGRGRGTRERGAPARVGASSQLVVTAAPLRPQPRPAAPPPPPAAASARGRPASRARRGGGAVG
jgi:hypothetical protein